MRRTWITALGMLSGTAMAEDAVTLGAEIGAGGRAPGFALPAEDALGLNVAGRLELVIPAALRARADVRYLEGQFTEDSGQRFFDLSVAAASRPSSSSAPTCTSSTCVKARTPATTSCSSKADSAFVPNFSAR